MAIPFGKYALLRKLAEGGMAEVFLARQTGLEGFEKLVVVKRILPMLHTEADFVKMFINEARVAARLNHPNVVQIFDMGRTDELYFIAMEYVNGEDLRSLLRQVERTKTPMPPGLICRVIADTLAGLHYAHTRIGPDGKPLGLVHRDVSPQNVLVTYEGGVKLVDFGIAKATQATSEQTQAGLFKGKFAYMSPEQSRGYPVDARSDVFSAGILLWELLTRQRLFKRASEMSTLLAVSEDMIQSPLKHDASLPADIERVVLKALERGLNERYPSAQAMRADLEALIRTQGWQSDSLALQQFMRELFADKLKQQDEDVRNSGRASLEDFLLSLEEKSSVSWIGEPAGTPSVGVVSPPEPGQPQTRTGELTVDAMPTPREPPRMGEFTEEMSGAEITAPTQLDRPVAGREVLPPTESLSLPMPREASPSLRPLAEQPSISNELTPEVGATTSLKAPPKPTTSLKAPKTAPPLERLDAASGPGAPTEIRPVDRRPEPSFIPTVISMPTSPTSPTSDETRPAALPFAASGVRPARERRRWQRFAVIGVTAALAATAFLTIVMWPSHESKTSDDATLQISVDAPSSIVVDGVTQTFGRSATVHVKANATHMVTVQCTGCSVRTVQVPNLAPGEQLPLHVSSH